MSIRRSRAPIQDYYNIIQEAKAIPSVQRKPSSSPKMNLKGLLGTLPPDDKEIPIPSYAFPKLRKIVEDLQSQITSDETKTLLWLDTTQYMFLKNLIIQIEQKISNKKIPKTTSYGVSVDVLLLLVGKLQKYTVRQQQVKLKQILMVMDKFIAIEKCLIGKIESQQALRDKLIYDLDVLFEAFLIEVISIEKEWTPVSIQSKLKRRLIAVSEQDLHPIIEQCSEEHEKPQEIIIETRTHSSLYKNIRNQLLLLCNEFAVELPMPLTITMEYIRASGKLICEHSTSIENIISVFVMMGHSKKNAILISGLVKFYCDMQKDAKMSSITRFLLVLAQFKKAQNKQAKKDNNTIIPETIAIAKNAEKVMNNSRHATTMNIIQMHLSMGIPLSEEEKAYLKEYSSIPSTSIPIIHSVSPREEKQHKPPKEKEGKLPISIPKGPKNPASLFGKYTSIPGKATDVIDIGIINYVKDMIKDLDVDPSTAGIFLAGFFGLRRSFQIEGWHKFVRSFNYHLRKKLGEKMRGREPETPDKLFSYGRTDFSKEKQVEFKVNFATLYGNLAAMGAILFSKVKDNTLKTLNADTSAEIMDNTFEQNDESYDDYDSDDYDSDDDRKY